MIKSSKTWNNIFKKSCVFQNNLASIISDVDLLELHWSTIEMDFTNSFVNNNVNNMISLTDSLYNIVLKNLCG